MSAAAERVRMDMAAKFQDQTVFHLTGKRVNEELESIDPSGLRPALLAGYRDLTRLRYDFPLVLVEEAADASFVSSLSALVNTVLQQLAPRGIEGERLRKHVLRLEREIRTAVARGERGRLSELWAGAAARLAAQRDEALEQVLGHTGVALKVDGEVIDCDAALPERLLAHAWRAVQDRKARTFHAETNRLVRKLTDILRAAFVHSEAGRRPESLRASVGGPHQDAFDFAAMSRLLGKSGRSHDLPSNRRKRIEWALSVLKRQRFFAPLTAPEESPPAYEYMFDDCAAALAAFRKRLPAVVEFVKAMSIAELEADGRYVEAKDDPYFEGFSEDALTPQDLALFPDYLVCIDPGEADAGGNAQLMEVLSSELPMKVLVQTRDLLEESSLGAGHFGFGLRSVQLASTAMGLNDAFILQTVGSNLYALRERVRAGLEYAGPALFSVFAGSGAAAGSLPMYLSGAAAMESRAFPAFTYDPGAGNDWASRFSLEDNPQPDLDWPIEPFEYADEALQRTTEQVAFTIVDFAACDGRYARHFACVPRMFWNANMIPVDEWLARDPKGIGERVPYVLAVDTNDVLQRLVVDAKLMQAARRCREMWHRLQELGGIHNSHAERLLAREKAAWEAQKQREIDSLRAEAGAAVKAPPEGAPTPSAATPAAAAVGAEAPQEKRSSDEPWIETARCPSCNECQNINDRMFAYNENKQAYIKDPDAGTYRQLVEAAEACQVAIIHPGKPRNPNEPGLDELMKRAEAFN
jgi:hypothetical protein